MSSLNINGKILCVDCGSDTHLFGVTLSKKHETECYMCMECTDKRENIPEPKVISESHISEDPESGSNYMFISANEFMSEEDFGTWVNENYNHQIHSDYDCTGKWFTTSICITRVDDSSEEDYTYAVIVNSARDV